MAQPYRLGLDIGTNSIGWAAITLDGESLPSGLIDAGARIFSDGRNPKDKTSLAVARRTARSARRRRDRYLRRRRKLLRGLTEHGLLPTSEAERDDVFNGECSDPYEIRARGLDHKLNLYELGRAIFHLNQRRGFKSNRKSDKGDENESGKIKSAVNRLRAAIEAEGARTLGEYLHRRKIKLLPIRVRMRPLPTGEEGKTQPGYDFYPDRALVEQEFNRLWAAQAKHYPDELRDEVKAAIHDVLFFQRPLRPVRPGKCAFNPEEERIPRAHPLAQRIRIYQEANNLRVIGENLKESPPLSRDDRDKVILALLAKKSQTFGQLRKLLKLPNTTTFNLESEARKNLDGDLTAAILSDKKRIGPNWSALPIERQIEIVDRLLNEQDDEELVAWLMAERGLSEAQAGATANANLPDGYSSLGLTATEKILKELEADVIPYSLACERAGYHHSDFRTGEIFDELPYYGRILDRHVAFGTGDPKDPEEVRLGKFANPTVHIGLNQLRHIVNAVIRRHGHPTQIIVELARELKQNKKQKDKIKREQKDNKERADRHRAKLAELGYPDNGENRLRLRLWEELNPFDPNNRRCPYSLQQIGVRQLFTGEVDIDHILPFSRTLDNSAANRTVCMAWANKEKRNRAPFDAFGAKILENAQNLPKNKRWRFGENAVEEFEKNKNFLDRQLVDTQYLARVAREYLYGVCDPNQVYVTPGRLTAMLRRFWGLNSVLAGHNVEDPDDPEKNRNDHRHHAIDAIVIGLTDRGLLNRVSREAARAEELDQERLMADVPKPWTTLRDDVRDVIERIIVSHRPDRRSAGGRGRAEGHNQTSGRLHNDTAYGIVSGPDKRGAYEVVHRVPFESLSCAADIDSVRDNQLREELLKATAGLEEKDFKAALLEFARAHPVFKGIRHVRVLETLSVIPIKDRKGKVYKAFKGDSNERFDVWRLQNGRWESEVVATIDANQPNCVSSLRREHPTAKKVLSLRQGDLLAWNDDSGRTLIVRVVKFSTNGSMQLASHFESGNLKARDADKNDNFRYINTSASGLENHKARQVRVDELGRVFDPGPRA